MLILILYNISIIYETHTSFSHKVYQQNQLYDLFGLYQVEVDSIRTSVKLSYNRI